MSDNDEPKDESTEDSEQQSDRQSAEQNDQSTEQSEEQPTESDQSTEQSEEQPTDSDQPAEQSEEQPTDSDQPAEQSEEQPAESDQPAEQSDEQPADSEQSSEQVEEQAADTDQAVDQSGEQPADSDQPATAASADNTLAFAGGAASAAGGGLGVQARPGRQPTRSPRAPVPQAPVKHDFAVRFTFLTSLRGFPAKGFYRFEISSAEGGTMLATHDWSSVSVTVPLVFNFSLTQITRYGEKIPSFDFYVNLSWLPFSTTSDGKPADPNDSYNADMIEKNSRNVTTLRPKDNDFKYLTIPPPKGTAVTKIDLHCSIVIMDEAVRAPSTNEDDFATALFNLGKDLNQLVEKGPPQQSTKDGVNTFLYEIKYYGSARIEGATVLP
jgi:hypothetical protein